MSYNAGELVTYRNRDWIVLPSLEKDVLMVKPLGGSDEETTGIFLPLAKGTEAIRPAVFEEPAPEDIGNFATAKLLYNASRLALRNAAGPFRCMAKLSFRPRAYQVVPLVMALKQEVPRLLIADDVGIGKTVEALIIMKELLERGEIKRFAVICPPHLCEQWQQELKNKLEIDAEIIRSSTASRLDRMIADDHSIFYHIPYQVISIDYIKTDKRRGIFLNDCPEMVIVDEAHTCTLPQGAKSKSQQQRYQLIYDIAQTPSRKLLLLTATPHSGKDAEFLSLLGLLKPEFEHLDFDQLSKNDREELAKYFIQRKRNNIRHWMNEDTVFPEREAKEIGFKLSEESILFYNNLVNFAKGITEVISENKQAELIRNWAAIALIKGAMSSPEMAIEMLERRKSNLPDDSGTQETILDQEAIEHTLFEEEDFGGDFVRTDLLSEVNYKSGEKAELQNLLNQARSLLEHPEKDFKIQHAVEIIKDWIRQGFQPIVFCHYIPTAKYVAQKLKEALPQNITIQAITSEMGDEQRKEEVEQLGQAEQRVLVATDCLSEGINLQDYFDAVLHYDLPWNPNRIEQREGRVDRFGQTSDLIMAYMLYGDDNPMDKFILEVLIRKVREIQKSIGVTISIGESNKSLMVELTNRILKSNKPQVRQLALFDEEKIKIDNELDAARQKGLKLRSVFAHENVDAEMIKKDLQEAHEAIGDMQTVKSFVLNSVLLIGGIVQSKGNGYKVQLTNLPPHLQIALLTEQEQQKNKKEVLISFDSPTPKGYKYIGRNHRFVEQLCHYIISRAFDPQNNGFNIARTTVVQVDKVKQKTILVMFRVRNVVKEVQSCFESVAEEMVLWAYQSNEGDSIKQLSYSEAKELLLTATPLSNLSIERQTQLLENELNSFNNKKEVFVKIANERADKLVEAHGRFKSLIGGRRFEKSTPVLPPDVMGVYILLPQPKVL